MKVATLTHTQMPIMPELPPAGASMAEDTENIRNYLANIPNLETLAWLANPQLGHLAHLEIVGRMKNGGTGPTGTSASPGTNSTTGANENGVSDAIEERLNSVETDLAKLSKNVRILLQRQERQADQLQAVLKNQSRAGTGTTGASNGSSGSPDNGNGKMKSPNSSISASKAEAIQRASTPVLSPVAPASASSLEKLKREAQTRSKVSPVLSCPVLSCPVM